MFAKVEKEITEDVMTQAQQSTGMIGVISRVLCTLFMLFLLSPALYGVFFPSAAHALDAMNLPECPIEEGQEFSLAESLRKASMAYFVTGREAGDEFFKASLRADAEFPLRYSRGNIKDTYCIGRVMLYFDIVRALLAGAAWIEGVIAMIVSEIFNTICEYAISTVLNYVNIALNKICIPIPRISFNMSLPSADRESCNGISLADAMDVNVVPGANLSSRVPDHFLSAPMSRWIQDNNLTNVEIDTGIRGPRF